jgi:hypothetical protein
MIISSNYNGSKKYCFLKRTCIEPIRLAIVCYTVKKQGGISSFPELLQKNVVLWWEIG